MMLLALICAAANSVAVLPIDSRGALSPAEAASFEEEVRAVARAALPGFAVLDAAGAPQDPSAARQQLGATAVIFGRAGRIEGATMVALGVYRSGSTTPAGTARIVGIGIDQLKEDARAKVPKLLRTALGIEAPAQEPAQRPGTLRMPGARVPEPAPPPPKAVEPAPQRAPSPPPKLEKLSEATADPLITLIRQITSDLESLRGLRRKANLKVQILDAKLFSAALRERAQKELTPALVAAERARWLAFNLAPASADPAKILLAVLDEQVAGFYDPFTKQLIVRKDVGGSAGPDGLRLILAHEIEHALQDQNFGFPDPASLPDDDARLARLALYEGDAMAVMAAYGAKRARRPIKAAIASSAAALKALDTDSLLRMSGHSSELLKAPAIVREELLLPYSAGLALVADVYARGGFALVDRMFKNPPLSSHQLLHPDAYFAGEMPAAIAPPAAPAGTRVIATGRMGELGTRVALESCVEKAVIGDFARRWAGDAYTIVEGPRRSLSLLWVSLWSEEAATGMANLLRMQSPCWEEAASPAGAAGWTIAATSKVRGEKDRVAAARGSIDLDAALGAALAARAAPSKGAPPLGDVPPPPAPPEPARVEDGRFVSSWLSLEGPVPEGYELDSSNAAAEISIKRSGPVGGSASLSFVSQPLAGESLESFFDTAAAQISASQGGGHLSYAGRVRRVLAGVAAEERSWKMEGGGLDLRIEVGSFCEGKAALTLVRLEGSDAARAALDRFAASIKPTGTAPACAQLE